MSEYDSSKSEYENITNKMADIREYLWDVFPEYQCVMMGNPYEVALLAERYIVHAIELLPKTVILDFEGDNNAT